MVMAIDERSIVFDFGFTAISETELDAYQESQEQIKQISGEAGSLQERLDKLFNAVQPLLANLKKDPQKDYILWPQRLEKIEAFEDMLQDIYSGKV
jgi:predicted nuclease with TOPRIM domain